MPKSDIKILLSHFFSFGNSLVRSCVIKCITWVLFFFLFSFFDPLFFFSVIAWIFFYEQTLSPIGPLLVTSKTSAALSPLSIYLTMLIIAVVHGLYSWVWLLIALLSWQFAKHLIAKGPYFKFWEANKSNGNRPHWFYSLGSTAKR